MSRLDAQRDRIRAAVVLGASQRELAKQFGVARSTMQDWLKTNHIEVKPPTPELDADILKAEVKDLRAQARKVTDTNVQFERVLKEIQSAVLAAPVEYVAPDTVLTEHKPHVQTLLLSDLHAGEVVDPEAINGLNEYNWDILVRERMPDLQAALLSFQSARPYPINELHIWCLGDMCSGHNHQELAETNEFPSAEQAYRVGMLLGQWIEELVPYFPRIVVECVPGNHSRLNKAPANKQVFNNFDWLAYKIAETYLANYVEAGSVSFVVTRSGYIVSEVAGNNILLFHGDGIRSTMAGVPWGGVTRRWAELKKGYAEQGIYLDGAALGHFHQSNVVGRSIFMNGSVKGTDEYVQKNFGSGEKPCQLLLTWDPEHERLTDASFLQL